MTLSQPNQRSNSQPVETLATSEGLTSTRTVYRSHAVALPVEILRIVFQDAAYQYVASEDNLKSDHPSRFPFNVAGVCTLWRDILADFAEYWTDLLILVDNVFPTHLSELQLYVSFSQDLPINVKVTRAKLQDVPVGDDVKHNEIVHTKAVIEILRPHFSRCKSIYFDVLYDASLPSVRRDLLPLSRVLESLILKSVHESGNSEPNPQDSTAETSEADPDTVFLSGKAALEVLNHESLFSSGRWNRTVSISNYSTPLDLELSTLFFTLLAKKFPDVLQLTLENITIPFIHQNLASSVFLRVYHLRLVRLNQTFLHFLFNTDLSEVRFITITDCTLSENLPFLNPASCDDMILCRVGGSLGVVLAEWDGLELIFDDCADLTNDIIHALAARMESGRYSELCRLKIVDCQNFTPRVLFELAAIFGRTRVGGEIIVSGSAPPLSEQELETLQSLIGVLEWQKGSFPM